MGECLTFFMRRTKYLSFNVTKQFLLTSKSSALIITHAINVEKNAGVIIFFQLNML